MPNRRRIIEKRRLRYNEPGLAVVQRRLVRGTATGEAGNARQPARGVSKRVRGRWAFGTPRGAFCARPEEYLRACHSAGFINADEIMSQVTVEQVAALYGAPRPELKHSGQETNRIYVLGRGRMHEMGIECR